MDQRTKNRDIAAVVPPVKQQDIDKNGGIVIEKEQQEEKASIGEEEEEESGGGGGELQAATRKKQRGKYRQYEDSQVILEKIRVYRTQRYPDSEIMKLLDNIPRRTYYNHVKKLQEQDRQIMEQWMSENVEQVSEELMIFRETLCQKLREVQGIIDNKNTAPKDKMQAIEQYLAISEKLVKFDKSGRLDAMRYVKYSTPSPY
jgi:DNA-binding transcriptional MerR regulator